ncbi:MAG: hypothetical protein J6R59_07855 [Paludibacteraceae bacterium]|jgi:hypothetical protein|nr:hypothetical protein [Paludibacteraceae bacterium]
MVKQIFARIFDLIVYPQETWETIKTENVDGNILRNKFYFPLIVMMIICATIGSISTFLFEIEADFVTLFLESIKNAVVFFIAYFLGFFVVTLIFNELLASPFFSMERDLDKCFTLFAYSSSLMWCIKALVLLFPNMLFLYLLNFYAIYLIWTGAVILFDNLHKDMTVKFTLIALLLLYCIPLGIENIMLKLIP